jgi:hypothetical protein
MRLFISSTFRDMQAERDHLVRFVFPRLREELLRRRIHLVDVDLRWGVTADQDAFDLCMDEIDRCRPRFICMLGGRYGWVPPPEALPREFMDRLLAGHSSAGKLEPAGKEVLTDLYELDEESGLYRLREKPKAKADVEAWNDRGNVAVEILQAAQLPEAERSITASEILYGALDEQRLETPTYRYFYFRAPPVPEGIPEELAGDHCEEPRSFGESALTELKDRIRKASGKVETAPGRIEEVPFPVREYSCAWDPGTKRIIGLKAFGEQVYEDLLASADAEFGTAPVEVSDVFAEENALAEAFVETRVERYVIGSRKPVFDALFEHAVGTGGNGYLCVVGPPGSGKSALLGKFQRDYVGGSGERHPHEDLVISHFVGVNATNVRELLRRVCHELAAGAGLGDEIPADYEGLRNALPELLEKAAAKKHVVLLVDAINQLDPADGAPGMTWLPDRLPGNARVILTAVPSPSLEALRARREPPQQEPLGPLKKEDATAIIDAFRARYRKELDEEQRDLLVAKEDVKEGGGPLYLATALEELRTLGTYEEITDRIRELPDRVKPLFRWILERLEKDDGFRDEHGRPIGPGLVRAYCSYLAVGREGMSQAELVELSAPADPQGNVGALQALLRPYLMRRGELLDFFHGQLREAVETAYLAEEEERLAAHRSLAEYFRCKADPVGDRSWDRSLRGLSELPYHLTEGAGEDDARWQEVHDTLTDFIFLERKAADVGVVEQADAGGKTAKTYTGVFLLQDDFERALARMPGNGAGERGSRRPMIVTGTDLGEGLKLRCPHCNQSSDFDDSSKGREIDCPLCGGPLKVNRFVVERTW